MGAVAGSPRDPSTSRPIRLATRTSALAMAQSQMCAEAVQAAAGRPVELVGVTTTGDVTGGSLASLGGLGVFVGAVREAVLSGEADFAVHSLKDVPTVSAPGLEIVAIPARADARDALCGIPGMTLSDLAFGAKVGTGSLRRTAQLRAVRPDLVVVGIRGNVGTRLGRIQVGDLDAVVLASAGLDRLEKGDRASERLDTDVMLPAPGQGALALEARDDLAERQPDLHKVLLTLDDCVTRVAVTSERAVLNELEAGCSAPVGAFSSGTSSPAGQRADITLEALVAAIDGSRNIRMSISGSAHRADELGRELAEAMLSAGASELLGEST